MTSIAVARKSTPSPFNERELMTMATKQRTSVEKQDDESRRRLNVNVKESTYAKLWLHAIKAHQQPGEFLDDLIEAHCKDWTVSHGRGKAPSKSQEVSEGESPTSLVMTSDRPDSAESVSAPTEKAA
jgi:hypothetical protein